MSVLEITDLHVSYASRHGRTPVVHGVNLTVGEAEVVALVGESGSGKSTTAHAVLGLLPDGGRIERGAIALGNVNIAGWTDRQLRAVRGERVGLVPQDPVTSLDPVRRIGTQVAEVFRLHGERNTPLIRAQVLDLLDRVGLDDPALRAQQYPHELSGGMRQRVLIAIAVALKPRLLIADEPTSALDATVQRRILDLIDDLRREEGTSVLLVTHDLGVAADRAARIVVLKDGVVVEQGETAQILSQPEDRYTRQLLADAPALASVPPRATPVPLFLRDADSAGAEQPWALSVDGLSKSFAVAGGTFAAVDDVSFRVRRGTTHALVGESGSGKTTTARIVSRFLDPDAGEVLVEGDPIAHKRGKALLEFRKQLQLVYQNPFSSLDPRQSVESIIAEPLIHARIGDRRSRAPRVRELLDRVALPESLAKRLPRELSGGQRQRVAIARALAIEPRILVLDEAVSALDVSVQARILDLLDSLQQELGLTYLFISHDLAVVRRLSHTVSVMRRGRVVESGDTRTIFDNPTDPYTRELIAAVPGREELFA